MDPSWGCRLRVRLACSACCEDRGGPPRFLGAPFPTMPCSQTPPELPATSPCRLPAAAFQELDPVDLRIWTITKLNRFTLVTAWLSLCLRLTRAAAPRKPTTAVAAGIQLFSMGRQPQTETSIPHVTCARCIITAWSARQSSQWLWAEEKADSVSWYPECGLWQHNDRSRLN
jgi:hypothetical protein